jgi:hypothetical protein
MQQIPQFAACPVLGIPRASGQASHVASAAIYFLINKRLILAEMDYFFSPRGVKK